MLITRVELQNTKSYRDQTVEFARGTNAICGENGAGKSTLLEAIGFVLFNHAPSRQADFVRQGEQSGSVTVHFISSRDAREYQVARRFGKVAEYFVYDPELKVKIVTGRQDVLDWLKEHLGLEGTADPAALFRDAIGVPQGLLTAAFLQSASERKPVFDRLLQVDDFDKAYQGLRETRNYVRERVAEIQMRIAALAERVKRLPELERQTEALRGRISQIEGRLEEIKSGLEPVVRRRKELEDFKQQIDVLDGQIKQLEIQTAKTGEQLATAQAELQKAEKAARTVGECRPDYDAYLKAREQLDRQEEDRRERDHLRETKSRLEHQINAKYDKTRELEGRLREAKEAEEQIKNLEPYVAQQKELEGAIQLLREDLRELEAVRSQLQETRNQLHQVWGRLQAVKKGLATGLQLQNNLQEARKQLDEARESKSNIEREQSILRSEEERLTKQMAALEGAEAAKCPVCEQPLSPAHRDELLGRNRVQIKELHAQYDNLDREAAQISKQIRDLESQCANYESQLRQVPRAEERVQWVMQLVELRAKRAQLGNRVTELEVATQRLQVLEDELHRLGDPHGERIRLQTIAQKREAILQEIASTQQEIEALEGELANVKERLIKYANLDEIIAQLRAEMRTLEPNYERFRENLPRASELPKWQEKAEQLARELQEFEVQHRQVSEKRDQLAAQFDPMELEDVRKKEERLKEERSKLQGELDPLRRQMEQTEREIEELRGDQKKLGQAEKEAERLEHTDQIIEFIRNVIRKAGPYMVRLLAGRVSAEAGRIFRAIMEDPTVHLHWKEDYSIVLEIDGRERNFEQLSGGEQMVAALAVRLALLRELSAVDVAFFDEPTSNLDSTRRENLAEQIAQVLSASRDTGLSQLFVITHDDTFEQVTDHVIRVRKEHGESIVETLG